VKDLKLTEIMFTSLRGDASVFTDEEWLKAGDFACELRFFPHAFQCYQRSNEAKQSDTALRRINDVLDKITNVLEEIPSKLKPLVEEIRLSNPLDPAKWLGIANIVLKEYSDELSQGKLNAETTEAAKFALAFAIYCAKRSGNPVTEMNNVLKDLVADNNPEANNKKIDLTALSIKRNQEPIKVVCFGDNISLGLMPDWSLAFNETYHYLWSKEVDKKISLANNAISGAGVLDLCLYAKRDLINYKPDLALILVGNVDAWLGEEAALSFQVLYSSMLKILKENSITPIVVSAIPQFVDNYPQAEMPPSMKKEDYKIEAFVEASKKAAYENDVCFVDVFADFPNEAQYFANGYNQPNLEGQNLILKKILEQTI
jgi:hypothetical protein